MNSLKRLWLVLGLMVFMPPACLPAQTQESVVHAVLFYHPTCPHCHEVITQYLIPLQEEHGSRVVILGMDTSQQWANNLYWEAIRHYEVPEEDWAVPMMVVGDEALVGGLRIPERFSPILEAGLAGDGVDLPDFPALVTFLREQDALDPRYPDRLIARQAPAQETEDPSTPEGPAETEGPPTEGDTAETPDTAEAPETAEAPDTVPADTGVAAATEEDAPGEVVPADAPAMDSMAEEDPGGDLRAGAPGEALPESDTPAADPGGNVGGVDSSGVASTGVASTGMEEVPREADSGQTPAPRAGASGAGEGVGAMGLAQAARELESMSMLDRFNMDPTANSLSVLVLLAMVVSLALRGYPPRVKGAPWPPWVIPALVLIGTGVAAYLSYVEVTQAQAACGPVGDCNTVNQSEYATLFGFLPVGILGLIGYGLILILWVLRHSGSGGTPRWATLGLWAAALLGTLFSLYLTFLEPFVIGATCAWCLTSAVVMTLLLWASSPLANQVWQGDRPAMGSV